MRRFARHLGVVIAIGLGLVAAGLRLRFGAGLSAEDLLLLGLAGFLACGVIVVLRADGHAVGWLFVASGALGLLSEAVGPYAVLRGPEGLGFLAGWLQSWLWLPAFGPLLTVGLLVFPTGRPASAGWRRVAWAATALLGLLLAVLWFTPGPLHVMGQPFADNPLGLRPVAALEGVLNVVGWPAVVLLVLASAGSLIARFRRSAGVERQQVKWFGAAAGVFAAGMVAGTVVELAGYEGRGWYGAFAVTYFVAFVGLPVAATVAILRHGLYEIDRIVSRTLSYALLTALLAGVYLGGVLLLAPMLGRGSDLAVAASTLAAAAAFGPLRRRVQEIVDRRFNRARYDAQRIVEGFATRLRDHVDLEQLSAELLGAVGRSVEPAAASLWLRTAGEQR